MQVHISSGMYNRMKEYRLTPRNMVRAEKPKDATYNIKEEPKENHCPSGEDQVSLQRHIKAMQKECSKTKPNDSAVRELMEITYDQRRWDIEHNQRMASEILEMFLSFTSPQQVLTA